MTKKEIIYGGYGNLILAIFDKRSQKDLLPIGEKEEQTVNEALKSLESRDEAVIRLRYGLDLGGEGLTLRKIGQKFSLTHSRVGQIQTRAFKRLRYPNCMGEAYNYFKSLAQSKIEELIRKNEELKTKVSVYESRFSSINDSVSQIIRDLKIVGVTPGLNENLFIPIDSIEFSVRTMNCLKRKGIVLVGDLTTHTAKELLTEKNFGRVSLNEVKEVLTTMGLSLGMKIPEWPPRNKN